MLPRMRLALCLLLIAVAACDDTDDETPAPDAGVPLTLAVVPGELDAALFGVWGAAPDAVWVVGGTSAPDGGLVLRFDGDALRPEVTPPGPRLWWVWGADAERVWAVGEQGRILARRDGAWTEEPSGLDEKAVLWGVWGSGPTDLWAVGGSIRPGGPKGVVLRSTGDGVWTRVDDPALPADLSLYKAWGAPGAPGPIIVGEGGVTLRWDGAAFTRRDVGVLDLLFTVHGAPDGPTLAVGGLTGGLIFRRADDRWVDESVAGAPPLNGVFVGDDGAALVVGARGVLLHRSAAGAWARAALEGARGRTLHAAWRDAAGATWTVGGDLTASVDGLIATDRAPLPRLEIP